MDDHPEEWASYSGYGQMGSHHPRAAQEHLVGRYIDIRLNSARWFRREFVDGVDLETWLRIQNLFLDHLDLVPDPIWKTAHHGLLWLSWAQMYPFPSDAKGSFWRPPQDAGPAALTDHGRAEWSDAAFASYCLLWSRLWQFSQEE
jgi:hypothetical protein